MSDVFISYASADRDRAAGIAAALSTGGWRVWWDRQIPAGRAYDQVIEQAIDAARCVVVLWSVTSTASEWVKTEAAEGARRQILVPVLLDAVKLPLEFRRLQAADLTSWDGSPDHPEFRKLAQAVTLLVAPSAQSGSDAAVQPAAATAPDAAPRVPQPGIGPRDRRRAWPAILLAALAGITAVAGSAWIYWHSGSVDVPALVGKPVAEATAVLRAGGLQTGAVTSEPAASTAPGIVLQQIPEAGTRARSGSRVDLVVARAHFLAAQQVPAVLGMRQDQAVAALRQAGFEPGRTDTRPVAARQAGTVVAQSPEAGSQREKGAAVDLVIGVAKEIPVPDVTGRSSGRAREALKDLGFETRLQERVSDTAKPGSVLEQDPAAGTPLAQGSRVTLTVARRAGPAAENVQAHAAALREAEGWLAKAATSAADARSSAGAASEVFRQTREYVDALAPETRSKQYYYEVRTAANAALQVTRDAEKAIAAVRDATAGAGAPGAAINPDTLREARRIAGAAKDAAGTAAAAAAKAREHAATARNAYSGLTALSPQQTRTAYCNERAKRGNLTGDERKKFIATCLRQTSDAH